MGTAQDWMSAIHWGMFFAAVMLLWGVLSRSDDHIKPILSLEDFVSIVCGGLGFGLCTMFKSKLFHWPLMPVIAVLAVVTFVFGRLARRKHMVEE